MTKRMTAFFLILAMLAAVLCGCGNNKSSIISLEEAQKIALEDAGITADEAGEIHVHVASYEDTPCYGIYITVNGTPYEYMIAAQTGEILNISISEGGHSH